jgi:hypothetical protein
LLSQYDHDVYETVELAPARRASLRSPLILIVIGASVLVTTVLLLTRTGGCDVTAFAPGSGDGATPSTPLLVHDAQALDAAGSCLDRHLLQVADIAPNAPFVPLGLRADGSGLSGSYDGGGHAIVDLRVFLPGVAGAGLFSHIDGGTVRDLTLTRPRVEGGVGVAALAGHVTGDAIIDGVRMIDAIVVAQDAAALIAGTAGPGVRIDVTLTGGSVQVTEGGDVATLIGRLVLAGTGAETATDAPVGSATATAPLPTIAVTTSGAVTRLLDAAGPVADRAIGSASAGAADG